MNRDSCECQAGNKSATNACEVNSKTDLNASQPVGMAEEAGTLHMTGDSASLDASPDACSSSRSRATVDSGADSSSGEGAESTSGTATVSGSDDAGSDRESESIADAEASAAGDSNAGGSGNSTGGATSTPEGAGESGETSQQIAGGEDAGAPREDSNATADDAERNNGAALAEADSANEPVKFAAVADGITTAGNSGAPVPAGSWGYNGERSENVSALDQPARTSADNEVQDSSAQVRGLLAEEENRRRELGGKGANESGAETQTGLREFDGDPGETTKRVFKYLLVLGSLLGAGLGACGLLLFRRRKRHGFDDETQSLRRRVGSE